MHAIELHSMLFCCLRNDTMMQNIIDGVEEVLREAPFPFVVKSTIFQREVENLEREEPEWSLRYRIYVTLLATQGLETDTRADCLRNVCSSYTDRLSSKTIGYHLARAQTRLSRGEIDA